MDGQEASPSLKEFIGSVIAGYVAGQHGEKRGPIEPERVPELIARFKKQAGTVAADVVDLLQELQSRRVIASMLDDLRSEEGDAVTLCCDNPDGPPNNRVDCLGDWTDWQERGFFGDTLLAAVTAAHHAWAGARGVRT